MNIFTKAALRKNKDMLSNFLNYYKTLFMPPELNSGAFSFCPICLSMTLSLCGKKTLTLAITFEP